MKKHEVEGHFEKIYGLMQELKQHVDDGEGGRADPGDADSEEPTHDKSEREGFDTGEEDSGGSEELHTLHDVPAGGNHRNGTAAEDTMDTKGGSKQEHDESDMDGGNDDKEHRKAILALMLKRKS